MVRNISNFHTTVLLHCLVLTEVNLHIITAHSVYFCFSGFGMATDIPQFHSTVLLHCLVLTNEGIISQVSVSGRRSLSLLATCFYSTQLYCSIVLYQLTSDNHRWYLLWPYPEPTNILALGHNKVEHFVTIRFFLMSRLYKLELPLAVIECFIQSKLCLLQHYVVYEWCTIVCFTIN